jgi:hypothetical protein
MSITHVNHAGCGSYGCLVRAYVAKRQPELSVFIAYAKHGGKEKATAKAKWHEARLKAQARRLRKSMGVA